jgi:hypothetical protein
MSLEKASQARQYLAQVRAQQQHQHRRRRMLITVIGAVVAALVLAGFAYGVVASTPTTAAATATATTPADGGLPPWPTPTDPYPGVKAAGLSIGPMGMAEHYHAHLDIFVNGKPVPVAADIGIDPQTGDMTALHTHDTSGVLHIEAATKGDAYTLGQIFKEWGVTLTSNQIGALKTGNGTTLATYVNGKQVSGDPATIVLKPHLQVALVYGTPNPAFVPPASYEFEPGE